MRLRLSLLLSVAAAASMVAPATASAYFVHVIASGETLYSIAAADGLSVDQLAAANGLSPSTQLVAGETIQIPPQQSSSSSGGISMASSGGSTGDGDNDADDVGSSSTAAAVPISTTSSGGAYVVQPGDTLTAIAARAGVSPASLAAANGLDQNGILVSGKVIHLAGSPAPVASSVATSQPVGTAAEGSPTDPPYPTPERVTAPQVGSIAAANGVPASLATAIAWQESGFNNDLVSSADARGVMQIVPGTWQWIQHSLDTGAPLAPASAADNVRGGVLMLHSLLNATGGDPAMAAAGYFQGLPSVQQHGLYPETQQYVNTVLALERQFGGG
jgi:LysM repeat protein